MAVTFLTNEDEKKYVKTINDTAPDENGNIVVKGEGIAYDNTVSGIDATTVQGAIDKLSGGNVDFVVDNNPPEDTSVLWVDPDDNYDDGIVAITGATVGQTVKISEVDENGVPTAWEPVDFPEGGGGEKPWKKVAEIKTTEELNYISVNKDMEGNPLSFEDVIVMVSSTRAADATTSGSFGISLLPEWMTSLNSKSLYYNYTLHGDVYRTVVRYTLLSNGLIEIHNYSQMRIASKTSDYDFPSKMDMSPAVSGFGGVVRLEPAKSRYDMFDENGKFKGVTIGTDMITHTKMGVGTTLEVWVR